MTPISKGVELWIWPGGMSVGSVILVLIVHYVFYGVIGKITAEGRP